MSNQMKEIDWSKAPEGTTHFRHDDPQCPWRMLKDGVWHAWFGGKWMTVTGSAEHLYVERPTWSGEGIPPVGIECEHQGRENDNEWIRVRVLAHTKAFGDDAVVFQYGDTVTFSSAEFFRPLRTPEQIAAEEREKAIEEMARIGTMADTPKSMAAKLYDAGCRMVTP